MKEQEFKQVLRFLETDFSLSMTKFEQSTQFFGNIIAEYTNDETTVRVVIDRSIPEIELSYRGSEYFTFESLLIKIGASPTVTITYRDNYDSFGQRVGTDLHAQAAALHNHLAAIQQYFLTIQ